MAYCPRLLIPRTTASRPAPSVTFIIMETVPPIRIFTKSHRMRLYLAYDSKYLIPNMRVNASVTYVGDPLYTFWGFNGAASVQDYALWSNRDLTTVGGAKNVNYYGMSRDMLRVLANFQGQIVPHLNWAAGINFWWWRMGSMRDNGVTVNKNTKEKKYYDTAVTLYDKYVELGAIKADEKNGGLALDEWLNKEVFHTDDASADTGETIAPDPADVAGFDKYMERYIEGLKIERAAVDHLK